MGHETFPADVGLAGVSPVSLISSGITFSCRAPCVWLRPRSVTAASTNAQPVTLPGLLLSTTSSGCKVGPGLAASVSPRGPCPHLSRAFWCLSPSPARLRHLFMALQCVFHLPNFLSFQVLSLLLPTPIPPLSCTPWLSSDKAVQSSRLRIEGGTPRRQGLRGWEGDSQRGFWVPAQVGAQEWPFTWGVQVPFTGATQWSHSTKEVGSLSPPRAPVSHLRPGSTNHSPQPLLAYTPFSFGPQVKNDVCVF